MNSTEIRTLEAVQYLIPLREGGSLPAIIKAEDGALYVLKFRGAGQGKKALIAELIGGELARAIGLKVPELVFITLDERFGQTEPDPEIQDLLKFSVGLNLGMQYLSGAITYDPLVSEVDALTASRVVLLDSIITNIDRTPKNTNLLNWNQELWLIDHGASLYFHHNWKNWEAHLGRTFPSIKDHVLLSRADKLEQASAEIRQTVSPPYLQEMIHLIPDEWLEEESDEMAPAEKRKAYIQFLTSKLDRIQDLAKEAADAR